MQALKLEEYVFMDLKLTFPLNCLPWRASGAMNAGVPAVEFNAASDPWNSLQTPKSAIWTLPSSPSNKFAGFISRWIIR